MKRLLHVLKEWGVIILMALVVVAAFLSPRAVRTHTEQEILRLVEEHQHQTEANQRLLEVVQQEQEIRAERTQLAVVALVDGITCVLLVPEEERTEDKVDECISDALEEQGFIDGE